MKIPTHLSIYYPELKVLKELIAVQLLMLSTTIMHFSLERASQIRSVKTL